MYTYFHPKKVNSNAEGSYRQILDPLQKNRDVEISYIPPTRNQEKEMKEEGYEEDAKQKDKIL